jgi:hypothetical protein
MIAFTGSAHAATPPDNCFDFNSGTNTIQNYYDNEGNNGANPACPRDVDIPASIAGTAVTSIAGTAFLDKQLTSVTIPNSVTGIGFQAFEGNQLTSVTIPNSVTDLPYNVFKGNSLTSVVIPDSVLTIGEGAFTQNQLTSLIIGSSVTSAGSQAFASNKLVSVVIPSSLTTISSSLFYHNELVSVTIPNSITAIGAEAFLVNNLAELIIPDSVTSIDSFAFTTNKLESIVLPDSVTSLDSTAFVAQNPRGADGYRDLFESGDPILAAVVMNEMFFTRVYTMNPANPNSLTDGSMNEAMVGGDMNGDGDQGDSLGGHIINPVAADISYKDVSGNNLNPDLYQTGSDGLVDYLAKNNNSNDFSRYYRLGSQQTFTPPSINGFITPASASFALNTAPTTNHNFVYQPNIVAGTNTSGSKLAATGRALKTAVFEAVTLILSGAFMARRMLKKRV